MSKDEVQHGIPEGVPVVRCVAGGVFMGLANLVPGISGGTMLLAAGSALFMLMMNAPAAVNQSAIRWGRAGAIVAATL